MSIKKALVELSTRSALGRASWSRSFVSSAAQHQSADDMSDVFYRPLFHSRTSPQSSSAATPSEGVQSAFDAFPEPSNAIQQRTRHHDSFSPPVLNKPSLVYSNKVAAGIISETLAARHKYKKRLEQAEEERKYTARDLSNQVPRWWVPGHVYAPHDLSSDEMAKWRKQRRMSKPKFDALDQLGMNPLHHYKNFSIMSEYITQMGRIKHRRETGLRPVNHRKMAKAIRRAMGTGILMPGVHFHPELMRSARDLGSR